METSKRIANKAAELFRINGIRSTGMDSIAENLSISKKTIYRFYKNKAVLVTQFVERELKINMVGCKQVCGKADNAIAELFMLMVNIRYLFTRLNPAIISELEKNHPDASLLLKDYKSVFLSDRISNNLARGIDEQLYRLDVNRKLLAKMILENFILTLTPGFLSGGCIEEFFGYLIGGMVSSKGFAIMEIYKDEYGISLLTSSRENPLWNH